jgi:hypothetical protein
MQIKEVPFTRDSNDFAAFMQMNRQPISRDSSTEFSTKFVCPEPITHNLFAHDRS